MPAAPQAAPPANTRTPARRNATAPRGHPVSSTPVNRVIRQPEAPRPAIATPPCPCGGGCPRCTHVDLQTLRGNSTGESLPPATRRRFENQFGHPLSGVRIHRDQPAAARLGARAVTIGRDIAFAPGQYRPADDTGQALLGHEIAHAVQQRQTAVPGHQSVRLTTPDHPHEKSARAAAAGDTRPLSSTPPEAARQLITEDPWTREERVRSISRLSLGIVRDPILAALRRHDAADYLARLRTVAPMDRQLLLEDEEFQQVTRTELADQPRNLWYTRSILAFGPSTPDYVRDFERAVIARTPAEVIRLLREHARLRDTRPSPGVLEWIEAEFRGHPEAESLTRTIRPFFLHYEADALPAQREIETAVLSHETDRVLRLLRGYPELTDPARSPGLAEWIEVEYHGRSDAARVVAEARLQETTRVTRPAYQLDEAHYERHGGVEAIEHQRNNVTYDLARAPGQLRVIVRIRLQPRPNAAALRSSVSLMSEFWATTIEMVWNNRFRLTNGRGAPLDLIFVPLFTDATPHHNVAVHPGGRRSNANNWHEEDDGLTAAHEFGHLIGASDEYELPATAAEIPSDVRRRLTPMERRHSTWAGVSPHTAPEDEHDRTTHTIMGDQTPIAEFRHVEAITTWFNENMLAPGEPRYLVNTHAYPDGDRAAH